MMLVSLCAETIKLVFCAETIQKKCFLRGQNLTAVEGNASVYQVNTAVVSRITGEGRAEFLRTWEPGFDQEGAGAGRGGGGGRGSSICAWKL